MALFSLLSLTIIWASLFSVSIAALPDRGGYCFTDCLSKQSRLHR
jgi:hypothetical protein